ncbi:MAG: hypothetical protein R3E42_13870 [Burkholderiaceae bacterium]
MGLQMPPAGSAGDQRGGQTQASPRIGTAFALALEPPLSGGGLSLDDDFMKMARAGRCLPGLSADRAVSVVWALAAGRASRQLPSARVSAARGGATQAGWAMIHDVL